MIIYVVILSSLAALKYIEPETDMSGYMEEYNSIYRMTFSQIFFWYVDNPGYFSLSKLFSYSGLTYHYWFAFVEAIFFGAMLMFINKFSKDKTFSMLLTFTIAIFDFTLRGSKQTLGMGFTIFAFLAFVDKKYLRAVLLYLIAYLCHPSALIFASCFILYKITDSRYYWPALIIGGSVVILFSSFFLKNALLLIDSEHYTNFYLNNNSAYSLTTFIYYIVIFLFSLIASSNYRQSSSLHSKLIIGASFLCLVAQSLSQVNVDFFRLAYYFLPFLIVFPANSFTINAQSKKFKITLAAMTIFYLLYVSRNGGYEFMWQH